MADLIFSTTKSKGKSSPSSSLKNSINSFSVAALPIPKMASSTLSFLCSLNFTYNSSN
jgi:hypothetical protein